MWSGKRRRKGEDEEEVEEVNEVDQSGSNLARPWPIVLLKVAYYATSNDRNFAKLCQNYARIPKLCS